MIRHTRYRVSPREVRQWPRSAAERQWRGYLRQKVSGTCSGSRHRKRIRCWPSWNATASGWFRCATKRRAYTWPEGLFKTTGQVAAVLGNPGPGSANLLPGVITARAEGVPVLVLTSQHRLGLVYPTPPSTFQGQDQLELFRPAVKWGGPIFEWDRIGEVLRLAFREMWSGRPGPVHVELPAPILYEQRDENLAKILPPSAYRPSQPLASESQLAEAAAMLIGAKRPLVIAGSGVDRAGAAQALVEVVECLGCPVMTTMAGRASVSSAHPNFISGRGAAGDLARREAGVILVAGSRLGNLDLPYDKYWGDPAPAAAHPDRLRATRHGCHPSADAGHSCRAILRDHPGHRPRSPGPQPPPLPPSPRLSKRIPTPCAVARRRSSERLSPEHGDSLSRVSWRIS
jgi:thiamine pyrophosphate-dependent acetolactate synthase large subunit-like protein